MQIILGVALPKKSLVVGFVIVSIVTRFLLTDNYSCYCCHYRCQCALPLVYVAYHRERATIILMKLTKPRAANFILLPGLHDFHLRSQILSCIIFGLVYKRIRYYFAMFHLRYFCIDLVTWNILFNKSVLFQLMLKSQMFSESATLTQ